jgi:PAS domain S-box-containing protein
MNSLYINSISWEWMFRVLKVAAEHTAEGIVVVDTEGIIRFANPVAVKAHGYALRTDLLGKDLLTLHTPEQMVEHVMPFMHEAMRLGHFAGPLDHVRSDGTTFNTDTKMALVRDEKGEKVGLIIYYTATTRRQEAPPALAPASQRYEMVLARKDRLDVLAAAQDQVPAAFAQRLTRSMNYRYGSDNEKAPDAENVAPLQPCAAEHGHEPGHDETDPYLELRKASGGPLDTTKLADLAELMKRLS